MGMCTKNLKWSRGRARRYLIQHSAVERETTFMDLECYLLCSAQNPRAVQPGTPHGPVCLLSATLIGELSNTKPNALQLQTTVAKVWSRNTRQFFTSGASWAHCWSNTASPSWRPEEVSDSITRFLQHARRFPSPDNPTTGGQASHAEGD